ncbi:fatty-acid amide hydrolase 2-A [Halyomorpha halys]|uniref:fatty-acid amide hydrolase 2-A n=1 Tax=Halyomorpha halys TaxID=286706 RepID=UPI0006D51905|nr:fatty-acid amide hydrolase 2-A [Halyomorpha halys]
MWSPWRHRLLRFLQFLASLIAWPYSMLYSFTIKKRAVPPINNPLLLKKASELAEMIRERKISSTTVVQAFIERIEDVNPIINSVVQDRFNDALKEAKEVDKMVEANPDPEYWLRTKPLLGVPMSFKETIAVKGMSNNGGRLRPKESIAQDDCIAVKNLREAGAIPIVVTNTPELCFFWETYNYANGLTKNPYDTQRTAGGSSGGEASLQSAGGSPIGLGSDIAGSGRLPPMYCGIFGHKPTSRLISVTGHIPDSKDPDWNKYLVFAPIARSASDLALVLRCAAPKETENLRLEEPVDFTTLKVYYIEECISPLLTKVDDEIKTAVRKAALHFQKYGIAPKKITIKDFDKSLQATLTLMLNLECPHVVFQRSEDPNDWTIWTVFGEYLRKSVGFGRVALYSIVFGLMKRYFQHLPQSQRDECQEFKEQFTRYFEEMLGDNGVLILPVFSSPAHYHFQMYGRFLNSSYLSIFNLLEMPATACPTGLNSKGMPIGVQIAAFKHQDRLTIGVAKELENAYGGWVPPSSEPNHNMV